MIRKAFLLLAMLLSTTVAVALSGARADNVVVHPSFWWEGMNNKRLQVLLYGENIRDCEPVLVGAETVTLDHCVRLSNPNYLILYLNTAGARAQHFEIRLQRGKRVLSVIPYNIRR